MGDEPEEFRATRPGVVGHRELLEPPEGVPDPAGWVTSRISSVEDLALIVGRRAKVAIPFTNARDFEAELMRHAGRAVVVVGVWVGDGMRIESIEPASP